MINVEEEDPLEKIMEVTGGEGMDVSLDCTAGAGTIPVLLGIEAMKRKGGTLQIQGEDVPVSRISHLARSAINTSPSKPPGVTTTKVASWP